MLKMLITPREILRFPRYQISDFWRGIASCKTSRKVTSRWWGLCKVTSGVAWRPISHMCVRVSDLWRGMAYRKSGTCVSKLINWMLRQPVKYELPKHPVSPKGVLQFKISRPK